jgi:receptor protein-tyrosine kinase
MLRRRGKVPLLAEIPAPQGASDRPGAIGRHELNAYSDLASALTGSPVVLLTGPSKTDVAIGLAATATAAGRRVALLECDLASPVLAATLGLETEPGFAEYLRDQAKARQILQPLVLAGPASGRATEPLACIVAGRVDTPPSALLLSERCSRAVERLGRAYELVVIDGPSLAEDPDALAALARLSAMTILCVEGAQMPRRPPPAIDGLVVLV